MRQDLRVGRWEDVLADVAAVDAVITDPPFGAHTHAKQQYGRKETGFRGSGHWCTTRGIGYAPLTPEGVAALVAAWAPRCQGWFVAFTSHDLWPVYEAALRAAGRYVFAPVASVQPGRNVRLAGDGPASWTDWLVVSRPRAAPWTSWGALPGAYVGSPGQGVKRDKLAVVGAKPLWLLRALVRDYSRPGGLVCDPFAGGGTTLLAAAIEGRRSVGAEVDPATHAAARARLAAGYTPDLFAAASAAAAQQELL